MTDPLAELKAAVAEARSSKYAADKRYRDAQNAMLVGMLAVHGLAIGDQLRFTDEFSELWSRSSSGIGTDGNNPYAEVIGFKNGRITVRLDSGTVMGIPIEMAQHIKAVYRRAYRE